MACSIKEQKKVLPMKKRRELGLSFVTCNLSKKAYHEIDYYQSMLLHWCSFAIGEFLNWCLCGLFSFFVFCDFNLMAAAKNS